MLDRFIQSQRDRWAPRTEVLYLGHIRSMLAFLGEIGVDPGEAKAEDLRRWLEGKGVSARHTAICAARHYFRWAVGAEHSPAERLRLPRRELVPQRTLNEKQVGQLLSSFDTSRLKGIRDLALVSLMLDTGLRASEVCGLRMEHLAVQERRCVARLKGGKWGNVVFGPYTASALEHWLGLRPDVARPGVGTVFVSVGGLKPGRPLSRDGLRVMFRRMGKKAGIGLVSPHDMRRTFATLAIRAGASTRLVQLAGRWSNLEMVERYTQALRPEDFDPYSPVNRIMGLSGS